MCPGRRRERPGGSGPTPPSSAPSSIMSPCKFSRRNGDFSQKGLYLLPEVIVSYARTRCSVPNSTMSPCKFGEFAFAVKAFSRRNWDFSHKGVYLLPEVIVSHARTREKRDTPFLWPEQKILLYLHLYHGGITNTASGNQERLYVNSVFYW